MGAPKVPWPVLGMTTAGPSGQTVSRSGPLAPVKLAAARYAAWQPDGRTIVGPRENVPLPAPS
jgi:hypothetical protein